MNVVRHYFEIINSYVLVMFFYFFYMVFRYFAKDI